MFIDLLLMKSGNILFFVFLILFTITSCFGIGFVLNNLNTNVLQFEKDGYALFLDDVKSAILKKDKNYVYLIISKKSKEIEEFII